jgi:hypothetical protein
MGIFGDLDVAGAESWALTPDTYKMVVSSAEAKLTKNGNKLGLNINYTVVSGPKKGLSAYEWLWIPRKSVPVDGEIIDETKQEHAARSIANLQSRMRAFGIPEARMNDADSDDMIGQPVLVTVKADKNDTEQMRIVKVVLDDTSDDEDDDSDWTPSSGISILE